MDFLPKLPTVQNDVGRSSVIVLSGNGDVPVSERTVDDLLNEMFEEDEQNKITVIKN